MMKRIFEDDMSKFMPAWTKRVTVQEHYSEWPPTYKYEFTLMNNTGGLVSGRLSPFLP